VFNLKIISPPSPLRFAEKNREYWRRFLKVFIICVTLRHLRIVVLGGAPLLYACRGWALEGFSEYLRMICIASM